MPQHRILVVEDECLANLCANARDAVSTPEHATTEEHTIRLRAVVLPHGAHATSDTAGDEETQNSPLVRVDVVDDGVGIEGQLFDDRDAETVGTKPTPIEASGGDLYSMRGYVSGGGNSSP